MLRDDVLCPVPGLCQRNVLRTRVEAVRRRLLSRLVLRRVHMLPTGACLLRGVVLWPGRGLRQRRVLLGNGVLSAGDGGV